MSIRSPVRTVINVTRHPLGWAVEHDGQIYDASRDKEAAKAAANKRARASQDSGRPCEIRIEGERGF